MIDLSGKHKPRFPSLRRRQEELHGKAESDMPVMDEFKEEREALKHGTLKEKVTYFFDYYKWHTAVVVVGIAFAASLISNILFSKDTAFYAAMINAMPLNFAETHSQDFAEYAGIDMADYDLVFDTSLFLSKDGLDQDSMATSQKLMVYVASQEIDVFLGGEDVIKSYAYNETFFDLREFLSEEQIAEYSPYFYYIDKAVIEERNADRDTLSAALIKYPDPRQPETMSDPIPVGIFLDNALALQESYYFTDENTVIGVVTNTKRPATASKYIDYILQ